MKAICLAMLVAFPAFAQEQVCLEPREARYVAQYIERIDAENASLKKDIKDQPSPVLLVVVSVAAGLLVGGGVGAAVALSAKKQ